MFLLLVYLTLFSLFCFPGLETGPLARGQGCSYAAVVAGLSPSFRRGVGSTSIGVGSFSPGTVVGYVLQHTIPVCHTSIPYLYTIPAYHTALIWQKEASDKSDIYTDVNGISGCLILHIS